MHVEAHHEVERLACRGPHREVPLDPGDALGDYLRGILKNIETFTQRKAYRV
jgi:hypothetical protein